jgi:hypothetical protein
MAQNQKDRLVKILNQAFFQGERALELMKVFMLE